ncbi:hypothetical protein PUNSTDRAFT_50700 [Punctularia strigosozonata HHB-11173 SS5]|uniref:uncharacterized protein n=1 Tax=Punctularia strigosozonata (strain HHB-11173) TaxID=741275 RepID=UPI0004417F64|nr:uncharacterized protein PUNSTDRAFT_50700 [Punctularia strigosozonata HHB-11173 SS5]EIN11860.1 hypothetical protein PUNSTDRAFT_50700 [Punctularia strigosozonata HHB-11173 SS5]
MHQPDMKQQLHFCALMLVSASKSYKTLSLASQDIRGSPIRPQASTFQVDLVAEMDESQFGPASESVDVARFIADVEAHARISSASTEIRRTWDALPAETRASVEVECEYVPVPVPRDLQWFLMPSRVAQFNSAPVEPQRYHLVTSSVWAYPQDAPRIDCSCLPGGGCIGGEEQVQSSATCAFRSRVGRAGSDQTQEGAGLCETQSLDHDR